MTSSDVREVLHCAASQMRDDMSDNIHAK